ncbi:MAG: YjjW family glycine radical enzyme activase [Actinobacteria bacterium]|nr:YjjW family glycine radical enzyme activase [Actinomycetota bacterium]
MKGLVTNTIKFSTVDGPGNRFVVFLQGCNFNCVACHNPYTIAVCTDCGECIPSCPTGALTINPSGAVLWNESVCNGGDTCVSVCPYDSTPKARYTEVADLLADIRPVAPFLSGITVSGGEATQQTEFVQSLFAAVKADPLLSRLTCFVDSNGAAGPETWQALVNTLDGAMVDLKCLDPEIHRSMTGQPNDMVLAGIRQLHQLGLLYEVRLLLLAGINDDPTLMRRTADWLADINPAMRVKLIGFRNHGSRPHDPPLVEPSNESLLSTADLLRESAPFDVCVI